MGEDWPPSSGDALPGADTSQEGSREMESPESESASPAPPPPPSPAATPVVGVSGTKEPRAKPRTILIVALSVLGALALCAAACVGWFVCDAVDDLATYERAEALYSKPLTAFVGDGTGLRKDSSAHIVDNRAQISAARKGIVAAKAEVRSLDDSSDKTAYVDSLTDVDVPLEALEAMASSPGGPEDLAIEIGDAAAPLRTADDSLAEGIEAMRSKRYDDMLAAAEDAVAQAKKAESALTSLEKEHPGLGIAEVRDHASALAEMAERAVRLAQAYRSGDEAGIDSAEQTLHAMDSKYNRVLDRAVRSVANAIWKDPEKALDDAVRQLERSMDAHAKVYKRIQEGG